MKRSSVFLIFFVVIFVLSQACQKKQKSSQSAQARNKHRVILVLASDDSTAGSSQGWTLNTNGMVIRWTKHLGSGLFDETPIKADSLQIQSIIRDLRETGILQQKLQAKSKKIHHLIYMGGKQNIHLSWTDEERIPSSFRTWYNRTMEWCRQLKKGQSKK